MFDLTDEKLILLFTAIILIFTLILIYQNHHYQKKKKLQFILGPSFFLVNIKQFYKDKIKVLYEDIPYDELSSIQVTIQNIGNWEILKEDLIVPIRFNFDKHIKIIDWKLVSTKPEGIIANIFPADNVKPNNNEVKNISIDNEFHCDFEILSPKGEIKLQFVCVGGEIKNPTINATMIKGISHVNIIPYEKYSEEKNANKNIKYFVLSYIGSIFLIYFSISTDNPLYIILFVPIGFILLISSMLIFIYLTWGGIIKNVYSDLKRKLVK